MTRETGYPQGGPPAPSARGYSPAPGIPSTASTRGYSPSPGVPAVPSTRGYSPVPGNTTAQQPVTTTTTRKICVQCIK